MRESGIWHSQLARLLVSMRHTETLVVADAGLPVPKHVPVIDLGLVRGEPKLLPVLSAILAELVVERATVAYEARAGAIHAEILAELNGIPVDETTHEELKACCSVARTVVRTGDDTPYANVILHAGVPFGPPPNGVPTQFTHAWERADGSSFRERSTPK